jgi:hypothetical protein
VKVIVFGGPGAVTVSVPPGRVTVLPDPGIVIVSVPLGRVMVLPDPGIVIVSVPPERVMVLPGPATVMVSAGPRLVQGAVMVCPGDPPELVTVTVEQPPPRLPDAPPRSVADEAPEP